MEFLRMYAGTVVQGLGYRSAFHEAVEKGFEKTHAEWLGMHGLSVLEIKFDKPVKLNSGDYVSYVGLFDKAAGLEPGDQIEAGILELPGRRYKTGSVRRIEVQPA